MNITPSKDQIEAAADAIVADYCLPLALMSVSQDGYRSLDYLDARAIARKAYAAGVRARSGDSDA